jgi:hypothetical protein
MLKIHSMRNENKRPYDEPAPLLIAVQGVRLLQEKRVKGDPASAKAPRRLPRPPAENERLERKSTGVSPRHTLIFMVVN